MKAQVSTTRVTLNDLDLTPGKRARLYRLLYEYGPQNGTLLVLPIDQGLEHGPRDFAPNPPSADPDFQFRLAYEGGYSAIAVQVGLAKKYYKQWAGRVPLILKINGKTEIPPADEAFSPLTASVEDAIALGADAVGYTSYVGSPAQDRDFLQLQAVRRECDRFGMPLIVWAYPRGSAVQKKGGQDSPYAIEYAARVACELGADVVKLNFPVFNEEKASQLPKPYNDMRLSPQELMARAVTAAGRTLVLLSGGGKVSDEEVLEKVEHSFEAGVTGIIFGRNMWQRKFEDALEMTKRVKQVLTKYGTE